MADTAQIEEIVKQVLASMSGSVSAAPGNGGRAHTQDGPCGNAHQPGAF